jgi:signal transduction histidine kinase
MALLNTLTAGLLYIAFAAVPAAIGVVAWRNRDKPGATALVVTGASASAATVIQGVRFIERAVGVGEPVALGLHIGLLAAINVAVLGTLYIAVEYTGQSWPTRRWLVAVLVVLAIGLPIGRLTTAAAGLAGAAAIADADFLYRFVVGLAALAILARQLFDARGIYRKQGVALLLGLVIGFGFGLVERFYTAEFVEFTLVGMTLGSGILAWALFRYEFLETVPVARETLFDQIADPVVALDGSGRIADLNRAAISVFGVGSDLVGQQSSALFQTDTDLATEYEKRVGSRDSVGAVIDGDRRHFDPDSPLVTTIRDGEVIEDSTEFGIVTGSELRYYTVTGTPLDLAPEHSGQLVVFRDITTERERAADLDVLKQVLTRVLRHNLRNEVTVIRGFAAAIADQTDDEIESNAERIIDRAEKLSDTSETARRIESVIETDELATFDLQPLVEDVVRSLRSEYPAASYEVDVPALTVVANPEFDTALTEIGQNAVIHNDSDQPRVTISAERTDRGVELTVRDNGSGIPDHELETLDRGEETSLVHGSGAGLWLIQTTIDSSNGDLAYETGDSGTTVRIQLPAADDA